MTEADISRGPAQRSRIVSRTIAGLVLRLATIAVAVAAIVVAEGAAMAQESAPKGTAPSHDAAWLAKELGGGNDSSGPAASAQEPGIQLCLAQAADLSPAYPTTTFRTNDKQIAVIFRLGNGDNFKKLTTVFTAVDVGSALPPNSQVARGSLSVKPGAAGVFHAIVMHSPGKYKVDVFGDNQLWKSAEFSIVQAGEPAPLKDPAELVQLTQGRTWTYQITQTVGPRGKVTNVPPGISKGPDGKFHGEMKANLIGADTSGSHLQYFRGGALQLEEWWQIDAHGLNVTKRVVEGSTVPVDPPQTIWKLPLKYTGDWVYRAKEGNLRQEFHQWGPVPVEAPSGQVDGYVVLIRQSEGLVVSTVERHFVPSVGMVRQVYTTAFKGELVSREEMVLKEVR